MPVTRAACTRAAAVCAPLLALACSTEPAPPPAASSAPVAANAVQVEMGLLSAAMHGAFDGIALGDVRALPDALHQVHAAKGATEAAVTSGAYRLPKNPDAVARFRELDEAFHAHLVRMVQAARNNDVEATAAAFGDAVRGCPGCHAEFRP